MGVCALKKSTGAPKRQQTDTDAAVVATAFARPIPCCVFVFLVALNKRADFDRGGRGVGAKGGLTGARTKRSLLDTLGNS